MSSMYIVHGDDKINDCTVIEAVGARHCWMMYRMIQNVLYLPKDRQHCSK